MSKEVLQHKKADADRTIFCPGCGTAYEIDGTGKVQCEQCGVCITC